MSIAQRTGLVAHVEPRGILVRGPYTAETNALIGTLPAKWSVRDHGWICEATACSAARIIAAGGDVSDDVTQLAAPVVHVRPSIDSTSDLPQPTDRVYDAWHHQLRAFHFAGSADAALLALDMGLGKSKVTCDLAWNLGFRTTLILAPVSVCGVWRREFARHAPDQFDVVVLDQDGTKRKADTLGDALRRTKISGRRLVVVVNYESAWREPLGKLLASVRWDAIGCDESHKIKAPNGKAAKFVASLRRTSGMRLCLTGTPTPHSPGDLFAQFRFLDPGVFGTAWTRFRQRFAVCGNPSIPQQITEWVNQAELGELAALLMLRITREEAALGLPEAMHVDVPVTLGAKARKIYDDLERESVVDVEGGTITAANALVELVRLRQITSGVVGDDEKSLHRVDDAKQQALADFIDGLPRREPVVVFCQFRSDLESVRLVTEAAGLRFGEISGSRKDLTPHSTMPDDVDVMAVQWQSGGVGIDLTRACYAVIYSPTYSGGEYEQGLARIHRPGQTRPCSYHHLIAEGTVDRAVYKALTRKKEVVEAVLSYLKKEARGE